MANANFSGGGQGDDILGQVDSMIDGRVTAPAKRQKLGADGKPVKDPTLFQQLRDGLVSLGLAGDDADRKRVADNAKFRGTPADQAAGAELPPQPGQPPKPNPTGARVNPDGSPVNSSKGFLDGLLHTMGRLF